MDILVVGPILPTRWAEETPIGRLSERPGGWLPQKIGSSRPQPTKKRAAVAEIKERHMDENLKKPGVSLRKIAANRANSQHSTGPKTPAGRAKSAQNSYKHGFFSLRLFATEEQRLRDGPDCSFLYKGLCDHFSPVGIFENLLVDRMVAEVLRQGRLFSLEQTVLSWRAPFEARSVDRIIRYQSMVSRGFTQTLKELEHAQEKRKAISNESESSQPVPDDAVGELGEMTEEPLAPLEDVGAEAWAGIRALGNGPEESPETELEDADTGAQLDVDLEESMEKNPNAGARDDFLPPEVYGTNPPSSSRSTAPDGENDIADCT
jgi:hypothetical protein